LRERDKDGERDRERDRQTDRQKRKMREGEERKTRELGKPNPQHTNYMFIVVLSSLS